MEPIGVWVRSDGEWAIVHRCKHCGKLSSNRIAADDNPMKLMALAIRPFVELGKEAAALQAMLETMQSQGE